MSQITFTSRSTSIGPPHNGHRLRVLTGWDRPLQHHFLTVFDLDNESAYDALCEASSEVGTDPPPEDDYPTIVWSSMGEIEYLRGMGARDVVSELERLGLDVPETLFELLVEHRARDAGNEQLDLGER